MVAGPSEHEEFQVADVEISVDMAAGEVFFPEGTFFQLIIIELFEEVLLS